MNKLFTNIDNASKIRILQELEGLNRVYKKNSIILSSIKKDNIICIVTSGHVQVVKNEINGNSIVIEDLHEDDIFGAISSPISSSEYEIITKEDANIIILELDNILAYNSTNPDFNTFIKNLINVLYDRIKEFNNHIEILNNKTIRNKLLAYFRIMTRNSNNRVLYLPFSYSNLADYLATNRSAMSREMKLLKEEGLIEVKGRKIKLLYYNKN